MKDSRRSWTLKEEQTLEAMYKARYKGGELVITEEQMCRVLKRSGSSVRIRINTMGLRQKYPQPDNIDYKLLSQIMSGGGKTINV